MSVSKETIQKIRQEKIAPIPKWHFLLKNDVILAAAVTSALVGSIGVAVIIHVILNRDWFLYTAAHRPLAPSHLLSDIPSIWLILLVLTILLAYYNVKHSKSGYRYSAYWIVLGSLIFSLIFGALFNIIGLGARVDAGLAKDIPAYQSVENQTRELWSEPDEGRLGGTVTKISGQSLELKDSSGKIWQVSTTEVQYFGAPVKVGQEIKIIGEKTGDNTFDADEIHPSVGSRPRRIFIRNQESMLVPPPPF
ncbi:MAG: hypothetical protein ABSE91_01470 [Patescibacteria group bacterium]|jgi:hypothetical protein